MSSTLLVAVSPMSRSYDSNEKMAKDGKKQIALLSLRENDTTSSGSRTGLIWQRSPTSLTKAVIKELATERHTALNTRKSAASTPRRSSSLEAPRSRLKAVEKSQKLSEASSSSFGSNDSSGDEERKKRAEDLRAKRSSLTRSLHSSDDPKQADAHTAKVATQRQRRSSSLEAPRPHRDHLESRKQCLDLSLPSEGGEPYPDSCNQILQINTPSLTRQRSLDDIAKLSASRKGLRSPPNGRSSNDSNLELEKLRGVRSTLGRQRIREDLKPQLEMGKTIRVASQSQRPPRYKSADDLQRDSGHESVSSAEGKFGGLGLGLSLHESGSSFESDKSNGRVRERLSSPMKQRLWDELKPKSVEKPPDLKRSSSKEVASSPSKISTKSALERVLEAGRKLGVETGKDRKVKILERQDSTDSLTLDDLGLEGTWHRDAGHPSADSSRNAGKAGSMATSSFLASNVLGGSTRQHSLPILESVVSFGDSMTSTMSQQSILREGKFSKSRLQSSRSSLISSLSESQKSVSFATTVTIINETNPGRLMITRRQLPQAGPSIKTDAAYGHQAPRVMTTRSSLDVWSSSPPHPTKWETSDGGRRANHARRNSLDLIRPPSPASLPPAALTSQERPAVDQQQTNVKQSRQAKANAAFRSLGGMLQPR